MPLFDVLPPDLFKPLAASTKRLYSDLLIDLLHRTFEPSAEAPRRVDVLREIEAFLMRRDEAGEAEEGADDLPPGRLEERARTVYDRLIETGWLVEHRDRYLRLVDLDPEAAGLLHLLSRIERGETRSYGGAVLEVLSGLEGAAEHPDERSESLRNALRSADDFMAHMRTVAVTLRQAEERILRQPSLRAVFHQFFGDFVERHLIRDYKTLHTKDNPFRFRTAIIRRATEMIENPALLSSLGEAYGREGRSPGADEGEAEIRTELSRIVQVFEAAERHLEAINATVARIERRMVNAARHMDRMSGGSTAELAEALRRLGADTRGEVAVAPPILPRFMPIGPVHIPSPRRDKPPVSAVLLRDVPLDPAAILYARAKDEYVRRTRVTAPVLTAYLERLIGVRAEVRGRDVQLGSIDDFVAFQRLRELPSIFGGTMARRYEIEFLDARCANRWIVCQDFVIRRRMGTELDAA
ncbi:Wadjet anti-phage system protein JetA family protein [Aureimonas sp. ME7]|uniref:Wadjet anti-phage system protein JetA family protein n=1 Tax=Aureimonas sp. ME7 TaxID=2744252 RepID=UPI0015F6F1BF|nr:Wadjet anti-phage system protein JetA family protein [Aureimonas sp. ME7]